MMVTTGIKLIIVLLFVGALYTTDATISAWSEPAIVGAASGAGAYSFAEDIATGTAGIAKTIAATSDDTPIAYTLITAGTPFAIDSTTGVLSLEGALDFEAKASYTLEVQAVDATPTTGTATITVTVTDENDAPAFGHTIYSVNIADGSTAGTTVTTVSATDVDASDTITHTITSGNDNTDFDMDASTGVITVSNGKTLAADTVAAYTLIVTATDVDSASATTTVSIVVKKAGDNSGDGTGTDTGTAPIVKESDPVFSASSFSPCIADKSPAGTTLTTVTATVKDTSDTFTYAIASGDPGKNFTIDPNSGLIQVNAGKTLDKAATPSYSLVVTAADKVVTTKTGSTTVSVTVADSCDSGTAIASISLMMLIVSLFMTLF